MKRRKKRICFLTTMVLTLGLLMTACTLPKKQRRTRVVPTATAEPEEEMNTVEGIVVENDVENREIHLRELDTEEVNTFAYTDDSVNRDEFGQEREGEKIQRGEILQVVFPPGDASVSESFVPEDAWGYSDVKNFTFRADESMLSFIGKNYQYGPMTYCLAGSEQVQPTDYDQNDVLTIRGVGIHVYSIVRVQGHGTIRLLNYQDFVGGIVEVGSEQRLKVKENMRITVAEGSYRVKLKKNQLSAVKTVEVANGQEAVVDFGDYKKDLKNIGEITFDIEPEGAELTLNGTAVDYSTPVMLHYGKYRMNVSLPGYETWSGVLKVSSPSDTIHVELPEANETVSIETSTPKPTKSPKNNSSSNDSNAETRKYDSKHTITVTAPEGVEVFLDNTYKGLAPCTFTKVLGSRKITLSDPGYKSKTYEVDILDDDKNVKLSFADLEKEESTKDTTDLDSNLDIESNSGTDD